MMMPSNEKCMASAADWEELKFLREWIVSLPLHDLLHAMTFRCAGFHCGSTHREDEEWELLKEMVRIQPPPPIPIHPRAIPKENYRVAAAHGLTDGRCEELRRHKLQFLQPRCFQLFSRRPSTVTRTHDTVRNLGTKKRNIRNDTTRNPNGNNYRLSSAYNHHHHDICYKSFASPWGEPLTIGTTLDQQAADRILLQHSRISSYNSTSNHNHRTDSCTVTCSFSSSAPTRTSDISIYTAITSSRDLLRLFQVTSRGLFLSQPYIKSQANDGPHHFAPWFHPDQEWFTLTKYLTSRFEVAVRDTFLQLQYHNSISTTIINSKLSIAKPKKKILQKPNPTNTTTYRRKRQTQSSSTITSTTLLEKAITTWPSHTIYMCFLKAMKRTLSQHILMYYSSSNHMLLRDHLLFQIFNRNSYKSFMISSSNFISSGTSRLVLLESLCTIPLLELGGPQDLLRLLFLSQMYTTLVQTLESQLLVVQQDVFCNDNHTLAKQKSKKKKKKHLQKQLKATENAKGKKSSQASNVVDMPTKEHASLTSSSDDEERMLRCKFWSSSTSSQQPQSSSLRSREHTQSTIVALTIIESIMEHVFLRLDTAERSNNNHDGATEQGDFLHSSNKSIGIDDLLCEKNAINKSYSPPKSNPCNPTKFTNEISTGALLNATLPLSLTNKQGKTETDVAREEDFYLPSYLDPIYEPQDMPTKDWNSNSSKSNAIMAGVSLDLSGSFDGWKNLLKPSVVDRDHFHHHPKLFTDFFRQNDDRPPIASSTAASVASSVSEPDVEDLPPQPTSNSIKNDGSETIDLDYYPTTEDAANNASWIPNHSVSNVDSEEEEEEKGDKLSTYNDTKKLPSDYNDHGEHITGPTISLCSVEDTQVNGSCAEELPGTSCIYPLSLPAQQQQPIQLSLADLGKLRVSPKTVPLRKSWSRGNLAQGMVTAPVVFPSGKEDCGRKDLSLVAVPLPSKGMMPNKSKTEPLSTPPRTKLIHHLGDCAMSESGMESDRNLDWHNSSTNHERIVCHGSSKNNDCSEIGEQNHQRGLYQMEDENMLREERNAYRDLALTLGAEVSKLRNLLAAEQCSYNNFYRPSQPMTAVAAPFNHVVVSPEYVPRYFWNDQSRIAMSDSGHTRGGDFLSDAGQTRGDYESIVSEDGIEMHQHQQLQDQQQTLNPHCIAGMNVSVEFAPVNGSIIHPQSDKTIGTPTGSSTSMMWKLVPNVPITHATLQSRLSSDIDIFMQTVSFHLTETEDKRKSAIARFERMVRKLWPRAQVKMYGSHVSNLCLPSSDLDFVICLPAVHKAFLPSKPGVLEGRNAIKESCQKLLARTLKGESWIDPRSIKVIERTAVPIIKVSTKDILAKVLQLDISFDGPGHYGLEAITMVKGILDEFPKVRPLTLVLKQFLLDRGLLTAYTGGLSSYCLLLMVTRFLQEDHCWSDCGSLLLGFLDFYGNSFDPAATGISVRRRSYFSRQDNPISGSSNQRSWPFAQQAHLTPSSNALPLSLPSNNTKDVIGSGSDDVIHFSGSSNKPPRTSTINRSSSGTHRVTAEIRTAQVPFSIHRKPCTFDPLFVEDPLNPHNNVGRNAFRIFQIKRAFADAHRALIASLDWPSDACGEGGGEGYSSFSILQCLLLWN